jgi:hypothetical protein
MKESFLIANISWNPTRWRDTYINPKGGHEYVRKYPGHESLNFKFDKKGIDTNNKIFGYIQWKDKPAKFEKGGIIIFYSNNTDEHKGQIVGIYCNVEVIEETLLYNWKGFNNNTIAFNIKADKNLSILFPISLNADNYKTDNKRLVGQIGFSYYNLSIAKKIVRDELLELKKSGVQRDEFLKLKDIYTFITGENFALDLTNSDELEQEELISILTKEHDISKIIKELNSTKSSNSETVVINKKIYKRNNKIIAQLKIYRNFKCQICGKQIKKKNGDYYIEAAHIKAKCEKGCENPDNILILCPNHHKEFDFGNLNILMHNTEKIMFNLNEKEYNIDLKIK